MAPLHPTHPAQQREASLGLRSIMVTYQHDRLYRSTGRRTVHLRAPTQSIGATKVVRADSQLPMRLLNSSEDYIDRFDSVVRRIDIKM